MLHLVYLAHPEMTKIAQLLKFKFKRLYYKISSVPPDYILNGGTVCSSADTVEKDLGSQYQTQT